MPCWPDFWEQNRGVLPWLGGFLLLPNYAAVACFLLWVPRRKGPGRTLVRIVGGLALAPILVAIPPLSLAALFVAGDPPTQTRVVRSADGRQAELHYNAGFLGRDQTDVTLTRPASCGHIQVMWHAGPSAFQDPKIVWLDNRHLRIWYHARPGDPAECMGRVGDVSVTCETAGW
jgi:hypothetical protein